MRELREKPAYDNSAMRRQLNKRRGRKGETVDRIFLNTHLKGALTNAQKREDESGNVQILQKFNLFARFILST